MSKKKELKDMTCEEAYEAGKQGGEDFEQEMEAFLKQSEELTKFFKWYYEDTPEDPKDIH